MASTSLVVAPLAAAAPPSEAPPSEAPPSEPSETELPSWDAELVHEPEPVHEPAPVHEPTRLDGNGSTVVGAMLLGGGVVLATSSGVLMSEDRSERGLWIAGATLSSVAIATGMGLLIRGAVKRKQYKPWRLQHDAPPQGTGMFAGGTVALSAGGFGMLLGGVALRLQDADDLPYGEVALSLGAASVVTGLALIIVGAKRGRSFDAWYETHVVPTLGVIRNPQLQPAGATLGVAGRF